MEVDKSKFKTIVKDVEILKRKYNKLKKYAYYFVTSITSPTISVAVDNINESMVHLDMSVGISYKIHPSEFLTLL